LTAGEDWISLPPVVKEGAICSQILFSAALDNGTLWILRQTRRGTRWVGFSCCRTWESRASGLLDWLQPEHGYPAGGQA
jgi:hypothetical protein